MLRLKSTPGAVEISRGWNQPKLRLKSTAVEINRWAIAQQVEKPSVDFNRFNRTSTEGSFFWRSQYTRTSYHPKTYTPFQRFPQIHPQEMLKGKGSRQHAPQPPRSACGGCTLFFTLCRVDFTPNTQANFEQRAPSRSGSMYLPRK